uniref:Uncharacterized protein n=1 Tax=Schistocephalus solidus TaxID=70667 RepID=A0A0X3PFI1_SCHSO
MAKHVRESGGVPDQKGPGADVLEPRSSRLLIRSNRLHTFTHQEGCKRIKALKRQKVRRLEKKTILAAVGDACTQNLKETSKHVLFNYYDTRYGVCEKQRTPRPCSIEGRK